MSNEGRMEESFLLLSHNRIRNFVRYLKQKRIAIIIAGVIGLAFGIFYSTFKKPVYTSNLTFSLEEEDKLSGAGVLNLASQFGFDLGGTGSTLFSGDNVIELLNSRRIIQKTLLKRYDDSNVSYADIYLDISGIRNTKKLPKPYFVIEQDSGLTRLQDSLLKVMYEGITETWLQVDKPNKRFDIYEVSFKSFDEKFSKSFTEELVEVMSDFYTEIKTKKAKYNVSILQRRVDSLYNGYISSLYGKAALSDANVNPAFQVPLVGIQKKQTDISVIGAAYGELLKNLEIAKYSLLKQTPLIQIIDAPQYPLDKKKHSFVYYGLLGLVGFVFLTILFLLALKISKRFFALYFS